MLILREVLGFSAREVAETLETTVASVNSALQRAREAVDERLPEQSQQATLRALGDDGVREIVDELHGRVGPGRLDAVVAMLAEDATFAMPPLPSWYRGREALIAFLGGGPLSGDWRWRHVLVRANGQPALAFYSWDEEKRVYLPFALNVLTLRGGLIEDVTAFIVRSTKSSDPETYRRWPEEPIVHQRFADFFERFDLPDTLASVGDLT